MKNYIYFDIKLQHIRLFRLICHHYLKILNCKKYKTLMKSHNLFGLPHTITPSNDFRCTDRLRGFEQFRGDLSLVKILFIGAGGH